MWNCGFYFKNGVFRNPEISFPIPKKKKKIGKSTFFGDFTMGIFILGGGFLPIYIVFLKLGIKKWSLLL